MNRDNLPIPETIGPHPTTLDVRDQVPPFSLPDPVRPPDRSPNVLAIVIDDMGFGASSAFGGPCRMPVAEQLAADGLRYSRFHTTALCAPTRTALLTGRNHHTCGMGAVTEAATAAPGYTGMRPRSVATIAQMLSYNGYATGAFGKMHQTPAWEQTAAGPFDRWPTHEGFDRFYGFLGAETNQFAPNLVDDTTPIDPPASEEDGYHLSEDLVDKAGSWIRSVATMDPAKPWFCYLSFGACHTPFHLPRDWRRRYRGDFSHGWDAQRELTLTHQRELGVVPSDAEMAPWTPGVPHWDELDETQRLVAERLMETYAAFAEHTDAQVGRLIEMLQRTMSLDNTLVLYLLGDNGASAEGGLEGTLNEMIGVNGLQDTAERIAEHLDELGGPLTYSLYPTGWAVALDTPYQWTKQVASHYGGTRNGLIVRWPERIAARGEIRDQWHHCIDLAPTILEAAGLPEPSVVDGVPQRPMEGTSMLYSFDDADAQERHLTQYFEIFGNRGIYDRGWTAVTKHRTPWVMGKVELPAFTDDAWELYDTNADWTQAHDVAAAHPHKLEELKALFLMEAAKHQVLPLDDRLGERNNAGIAGRRDLMAGRSALTLTPDMAGLREDAAPNVKNTSFEVIAVVDVPSGGADGVLVAQGGRFGGWSLYVKDGRPAYCHNLCGMQRWHVRATEPIPAGRHEVQLRFDYDGHGVGQGGTARLCLDGREVGAGRVDRTVPFVFSVDETLDVAIDRGTPVTEEYAQAPANAYRGTVDTVTIALAGDGVSVPRSERLRATVASH